MDVRSIQAALPFKEIAASPAAAPAGAAQPGGFGKALVEAIENLDQVQKEADSQGLQMASGGPVDLHDVMIAQDRASLTLDLAIQVRNKLVDSYHEVMRMQM